MGGRKRGTKPETERKKNLGVVHRAGKKGTPGLGEKGKRGDQVSIAYEKGDKTANKKKSWQFAVGGGGKKEEVIVQRPERTEPVPCRSRRGRRGRSTI